MGPSIARAQNPDERAMAMKRRGDELQVQKHYSEALQAYDDAYAVSPLPVLLYNRGRVLQFLGRYAEALSSIERFAREAPPELRARAAGLDGVLAELRANVTTLSIACNVHGARVLVRDQLVGTTPLEGAIPVNAGQATIEVLADGYFPFRREMMLPGGSKASVDAPLVSRDKSGLLVIKSHVEGARVAIDGKAAGVAPWESTLEAGAHHVVVDREGFDPVDTRVMVQGGERKELVLDPSKRLPVYTRWWFWTGISAIVATGVVVTIAVSQERAGAQGENFSPGNVRIPLTTF